MATQSQKRAWLKVSRTMLPGLPAGSRLIVEDACPEKLEVTFQPRETVSLFSALNAMHGQRRNGFYRGILGFQ
jgi:hypothetical protein